jgi:predicted RNase H-like HicB family nuclease
MVSYTAVIEIDPETGLFVGVVPAVPGAHTQAASLDELRSNLVEVVTLCLEEQPELRDTRPRFIGVQSIEVG